MSLIALHDTPRLLLTNNSHIIFLFLNDISLKQEGTISSGEPNRSFLYLHSCKVAFCIYLPNYYQWLAAPNETILQYNVNIDFLLSYDSLFP